MKKIFISVITVVCAISPASAADDPSIRSVIAQYKKYGRQVSALPLSCISFSKENTAAQNGARVIAREIHNDRCGGDPQTAPRLATFVVKDAHVFIEEATSGNMVPFNATYKK